MKKTILTLCSFALFGATYAQVSDNDKAILKAIKTEAYEHSHLENLGIELIDEIGPRLVGTSSMTQAHEWAVKTFKSWGIHAENQSFGTWRGWERGLDQFSMTSPRFQQLEGMQLAYSPATSKKGVEASLILLPDHIEDSASFAAWLPSVKGKIVLMSPYFADGRPLYSWKEHATEETYNARIAARQEAKKKFDENISRSGYNMRYTLAPALEKAGAKAIVMSYWSEALGAQKIFDAKTKTIPTIDLAIEDYGMLYRLTQKGIDTKIKINTDSKFSGNTTTFNTVATIPGTEKADEYVILSAHLDSWDGGTGATDNGTGVITMMEVARILKKVYPNPKRTIIVGLWGSEEQGLNGSRAFVKDNAEILPKIQVVFNQDSGTGRIVGLAGQGFADAYDYLGRWLDNSPKEVSKHVKTNFPGYPGYRGSDHASFVAAGVPAFYLESKSWDYRNYTWHTNRDTYDKISFDDLKNNVLLIASLVYFASEEEEQTSRKQRVLKFNPKTSEMDTWPEVRAPIRDSKDY